MLEDEVNVTDNFSKNSFGTCALEAWNLATSDEYVCTKKTNEA